MEEIALMSIDSPMVMYFLKELRKVEISAPPTSLRLTGGGGDGELNPYGYVAVCNQSHGEIPGLLPDGAWMGGARQTPHEATNDAGEHLQNQHGGVGGSPVVHALLADGITVGPVMF